MAKCGIERYDNLPAVVSSIDVDALRYQLYALRSHSIFDKIKSILSSFPKGTKKAEGRVRDLLEAAVLLNEQSIKRKNAQFLNLQVVE